MKPMVKATGAQRRHAKEDAHRKAKKRKATRKAQKHGARQARRREAMLTIT
jgi:hypothetical protein